MPELRTRTPHSRRLSDDELGAWRAFLRAHAVLMRGLEADLGRAGELSLSEYDALVQLAHAPAGSLRPSELAERVVLTKSGITRLLDRLASAGYVRRRPCDDDRRGQHASITPSGRDALRSATRVHLPGVARRFASVLTPRELRSLRTACERIADVRE